MVLTTRARWLSPAIVTLGLAACGVGNPDPDPPPTTQFPENATPVSEKTGNQQGYARIDLVSDQVGVAPRVDPDLVNAWGITTGEGGFWIADEETGKVSIFDGSGAPAHGEYISGAIDLGEGITGVVRNDNEDIFQLHVGEDCGPAEFIFASVNGQLIGVNGDLSATRGFVVVNEPGAVFTGVTIAGERLLAADLIGKKIDAYDTTFNPARDLGTDAFVDPNLPDEYGPFNIMAFDGRVLVAYAAVDETEGEEEHGPGLGIISEFDTNGHFVRRLATGGTLNAPWGMAIAPPGFGPHGGDLLVGNFGDGRINAFNSHSGGARGQLEDASGVPLTIDG
ncbi:MAG TPA: TIGR03118 family protein, partial [Kofleriaceae bacterium]|nr:TIGR03118 family protein [Kofleriaceae bacterium]